MRSHITDHDTRLLLIAGALIGLASLFVSIFWRVAFAIGVLAIFTTVFTLLALVGLIMGPLLKCTVASWRVVGRRPLDKRATM